VFSGQPHQTPHARCSHNPRKRTSFNRFLRKESILRLWQIRGDAIVNLSPQIIPDVCGQTYYPPSILGFTYSPDGPAATNLWMQVPNSSPSSGGDKDWGKTRFSGMKTGGDIVSGLIGCHDDKVMKAKNTASALPTDKADEKQVVSHTKASMW